MKNYIIGLVAVVATVIGVSAVNNPTVNVPTPIVNVSVPEGKAPVVNVQAPNVSVQAPNVNVTAPVSAPTSPTFGAVSGPDLLSPYWNVNGVTSYYTSVAFTRASTTACSIPPLTSTTSLVYFSWRVASTTAQATTWTLATSTNQTGTSTVNALAIQTLGANTQGSANWVPYFPNTAQGQIMGVASSTGIIPAGAWLNLGVSGVTDVTNSSASGICKVVRTVI